MLAEAESSMSFGGSRLDPLELSISRSAPSAKRLLRADAIFETKFRLQIAARSVGWEDRGSPPEGRRVQRSKDSVGESALTAGLLRGPCIPLVRWRANGRLCKP